MNIYRIFEALSRCSPDQTATPISLTMDINSCINGFASVFNINLEEVAIRFYKLFVHPEGQNFMEKIDYFRFLHVVKLICMNDSEENMQIAFEFYDYDRNGSIGSVDISNIIKFLDYSKIEKISQRYKTIFRQKKQIHKA